MHYELKCNALTAWSNGLRRWNWNLEVPGLNPPPSRYLDLFSVAPSSNSRPCCVTSQLLSLPPVRILNSLCSTWNICSFIYSVLQVVYFIYLIIPEKASLLNLVMICDCTVVGNDSWLFLELTCMSTILARVVCCQCDDTLENFGFPIFQ